MAIDFDGVDDRLDCGQQASTQITGSLTMVGWANYATFPETTHGILSMGAGGESEAENYLGYLAIVSNKDLRMFWEHDTGTNVLVDSTSAASINAGEWHHYAVTRTTGANSSVVFYLDGIKLGNTISGLTNPTGGADTKLSIGATAIEGTGTPKEFFDGQITEVAIWDTDLSETEISQLANARVKHMPLQIQPSNLAGYWPLDDVAGGASADGATLYDLSGTGNNGTGIDGANNTGLIGKAEEVLSYPGNIIISGVSVAAVAGNPWYYYAQQ